MRRVPVEPKRKRIMWDNDSARVGGRTSIRVLLDWLMVPENCERWCGSKARGGGETREQLCTEIREEMEEEGLFHRENANIRTQINELERSYASAVAWLGANGFDVRDSNLNIAEVGRHVLKMCRYFPDLHHVMNGRRALLGPGRAASPSRAVREKADAEYMDEVRRQDPRHAPRAADVNCEPTQKRRASLPASRKQYASDAVGERRSVYALSSGLRSWQESHPHSTESYLLDAGKHSQMVPWRSSMPSHCSTHVEPQSSDEDESRERKRLRMEETRYRLERKKLRYEVEITRLRLETERVLSRHTSSGAGVAVEEADVVMAGRYEKVSE